MHDLFETRSVECPKCGGELYIVDKGINTRESGGVPIRWIVLDVGCRTVGCDVSKNDVEDRQAEMVG
jgi:hypothetical protein